MAAGSSEAAEEVTLYHDSCHHRLYQLSCDDFDALWDRAQGCCELCGMNEADTPQGRLSIDHKGQWWQVRGLLCPRCNALMRRFDEGWEHYRTPERTAYVENPWHAKHDEAPPHVPARETRAWAAKNGLPKAPLPPRESVAHLPYWGSWEVGVHLGLTRQRVLQLCALPDFPEPTILRGGKIWDRADVLEWCRRTEREVKS